MVRFNIIKGTSDNEEALLYCPVNLESEDGFICSNFSITDTVIRIPSTVVLCGIEYAVTNIGCNVFEKFSRMQELYIPKAVTKLEWSFYCCNKLQNIHVAEANEKYKDVDGVLYSKDGKTLFACPNARREYNIPEGVEMIASFAFKTSKIEKLTIPESVTEIGNDVFYRCNKLKEVILPDGLKKIGDVQYDTNVVFVYQGKRYHNNEIVKAVNI